MLIRRPSRVLCGAAGGLLIAVCAGAVASATIPGDGNVVTACMLKNVGTIRLIDPSPASSSLMSHCTSLETQVSWNQKGQPGPQGAPGVFTGTLTSPNGAYSISVTDTGIVLRGPGATASLVGSDITLASSGSTTVQTGTSFDVESGGNATLRTAKSLAASTGSDATLAVGKDLSVTVGRATSFQGAGNVTVDSGGLAALRGDAGVLLSSPGPVTVNGAAIP